jgi:acid phosphatase type 7
MRTLKGRLCRRLLAIGALVVAGSVLTACSQFGPVDSDPPTTATTAPSPAPLPPATSAPPTPGPTSPPAAPPVVAAAGDIACEAGNKPGRVCQHKAVSDAILADREVGTVFTLGDTQYPKATLAQFRGSYDKTWGRFKNKTRPVPGNHEYETDGAAGYFDYFGSAAGDRTKGYYSFNLGSWHVVALNSEVDTARDGAQVAWLKADLLANQTRCVVAFWHRPRWSSGVVHGDNPEVAPFVEALYDANADLVLNGHEHSYERTYPLDPEGLRDTDRGIVHVVSGLGGKSQYQVMGGEITAARNSTSYGYSRLVLHPDYADITYVPAVGSYRDSSRLRCH